MNERGALNDRGTTLAGPQVVSLTYERGTVVLQGSPWVLEQLRVPELHWDARTGEYRLPAYRYAELTAALAVRRTPFRDLPARWEGRPPEVAMPALRPYQAHALASWRDGGRRGVLALPTGAGKTRVALGALAEQRRPALVLVPTRLLLEQWAAALLETGAAPARFGDGWRSLGPLTVATFASAERQAEAWGDRFELLVADEVHQLGGPRAGELLELFTAPFRLGLTATPVVNDAALTRRLGPLLHRGCRGDLVEEGFLAAFDVQRLFVDLEPAERSEYERCRERATLARQRVALRGGSLPDWTLMARQAREDPALAQALVDQRRARAITAAAQNKLALVEQLLVRHHDERSLVFCGDRASAYALSQALLIPAITAQTSRRERGRILADFGEGRVRALAAARVLNEGVDLPEARIGIVLAPSLPGAREPVQRLGRLLRPTPGKHALVYEIVARNTHEAAEASGRERALVA